MSTLEGQKALLIAPTFFGYSNEIRDELRRRGACVDTLPDRPFESALLKTVTRFGRWLVIRSADNFYFEELKRFGRTSYDFILVVNGQTLSKRFLAELRSSFPRARFVLYVWDSFRNRPSIIQNLNFFDDCFSFDPICSKEFNLKFRPLFFAPGFGVPLHADIDYDLSFIGTAHTDRYPIICNLKDSLRSNVRFYRYLYLQARWVFYAYRYGNREFKGAKIGEFRFSPLAIGDVQNVFSRSRAILDIEHPRQRGLTMRTVETIGASRKLVTTNSSIREYDFYSKENVCIIERRNTKTSEEFFDTPYRPIERSVYKKYSLMGWVDEVLANE
jgi:hypothetical protein